MRNLSYLLLLVVFFSCKKESTIETVIIDGNTAPHYDEITTVQIQNYINKIFIDLLGREPVGNELDDVTSFLKSNSLNDTSRDQVLTLLMNTDEYYTRFYEVYQTSYLSGVNEDELISRILIFEAERDNAMQNGNTIYAQILNLELILLYDLRDVSVDYQNGDITINEFMAILSNNSFYDEINMGAENFVLACFENFLKRIPTDVELSASVQMVDGNSSQIFFSDGSSRTEFINIITSIPEFYQGLTIDIYNQLLVRLPNSQEMTEAIFLLDETQDYQALQKEVMKTDEYAGF